jgi:hypothetical protein
MTSPAVYVACRISEHPHPPFRSERSTCEHCGALVWVHPLKFVPIKAREGAALILLCDQCAGL